MYLKECLAMIILREFPYPLLPLPLSLNMAQKRRLAGGMAYDEAMSSRFGMD